MWVGMSFAGWAAAYLLLSVAYSKWVKHVVFLDVVCVAVGFLVRVFAGCAAVATPASGYAITCVFALALMLGAGKRRSELLLHGEDSVQHRTVFDHYTEWSLDAILIIAAVATLSSYALLIVSHKHPPAMIYTTTMVMVGVGGYVWLLYGARGADQPAGLIWSDAPLAMTCAVWIVSTAVILWSSGYTTPH